MQALEHEANVEERPLRDLLRQLSRDGSLLVQQEVALARRELADKAARLQQDFAALALGGVILFVGVLTLTAALVLLLSLVMPAWASSVAVGAAISAIGALLLVRGKARLARLDLKPEQALESVQRDVDAVQEAAR
jgi:hypothetical protein